MLMQRNLIKQRKLKINANTSSSAQLMMEHVIGNYYTRSNRILQEDKNILSPQKEWAQVPTSQYMTPVVQSVKKVVEGKSNGASFFRSNPSRLI